MMEEAYIGRAVKKIISLGDSAGFTLPPRFLNLMGWRKGDFVLATFWKDRIVVEFYAKGVEDEGKNEGGKDDVVQGL